MGDFKIVGSDSNDNDKKSKIIKITSIIIISIITLGIIAFGFYYFYSHQTPSDYGDYEEKAKLYEIHDIEYTYEDYKQDEKALSENKENNSDKNGEKDKNNKIKPIKEESLNINNNNISEATKELNQKNDDVLQDIKDETLIDTTTSTLAVSIVEQTKNMNSFIDSHCGYGSSEWSDESFNSVKEYHDSIINSMAGEESIESIYPDYSVSDLQAETRYSIYENVRLTLGNNFPKYYDILSGYMKLKHPIINNINSISLEYFEGDNKEVWDNLYSCDLKATISTENGIFNVFLTTNRDSEGNNFYKILDIRR